MQVPDTTDRNQATDDSDQFSSQVQFTLSQLSSKFGGEINGAFQTMPSTKERAQESSVLLTSNPMVATNKLQTTEENNIAIEKDMRILHQANARGSTAEFQAFQTLGKEDYLDDEDNSDDESEDSKDESECDSGDDSDSESDSDEKSDSEADSDHYDSDDSDESSLGSVSGLLCEMESAMGVLIPEEMRVQMRVQAESSSRGATSSAKYEVQPPSGPLATLATVQATL